MRLAVAAVAAAAALILVAPAAASRIQVHPGKNAIKKALRRAEPHDTLRLHQGRYRESVEINKRVSVVGVPGKKPPVIDGGCRTGVTIAVRQNGVTLRRLKVVGADEGFGVAPSEVTFIGVGNGRARELHVRDTCDAEYGINLFDTGRVLIDESTASGFSDAGFYVGEISSTPGGTIQVLESDALRNNRGVIVENTEPGHVVVSRNLLARNRRPGLGFPTGIWLHNADGVRLAENLIRGNGGIGVHLDPDSDANRLIRNEGRGNPRDLVNQGTGNCGIENFFESAEGEPLTSCSR
jgi:parallel beta-helix repeat protein